MTLAICTGLVLLLTGGCLQLIVGCCRDNRDYDLAYGAVLLLLLVLGVVAATFGW